ncbi:YczE/YyaS/YitT family protein [Hazenella coriacea]|uniref:Membrane protein YczE n=1 Tax=Hazenella coriacea TaxID=1179467 RepID=A0A4R3L9J8_9BACL|nr:hypothetical protein [Hazenella coriacea]TCS94904.1 hypothetical protein EDD58_103328 [Hazenella coriacea]
MSKRKKWVNWFIGGFSKSSGDFWYRFSFFIFGLWIMALGTVCTIQANLGVAPWEVLHIGLAKITPLSIGFWTIAIGVLIVACTCILNRQFPRVGAILNMLLFGIFIDIIMFFDFIPMANQWWSQGVLLVIGIGLIAVGIGLYIAPEAGAGPRDGLVIELSSRFGWSIRSVRTIMELIVGSIGWFLGGPVHIGTLFFGFLAGPLMQVSIQYSQRLLQLLLKRGVNSVENFD